MGFVILVISVVLSVLVLMLGIFMYSIFSSKKGKKGT
jgi:hypothetical protein